MKSVSVIIVSWNTRGHLRDCLDSVLRTGASCVQEVIVVDNASTDGSAELVAEEFPEVTLIRSGENLGFARANNLALKRANGSILALVNSDVVVHAGCFERLAGFLDQHDDVGLVGPQVIGRDGLVQQTCRRLPTVWNTVCRSLALDRVLSSYALFSGHEMRHFAHDRGVTAEVLSGCFWMARRKAVEGVGELDERFFFYMEDVDWCKRYGDAGWRIAFVPEATAIHYGGASTSMAALRYSIEYHRANVKYWRKYHGHVGVGTYYVLASLHHGMRLLARGVCRVARIGMSDERKHKLDEDFVCLRWLVTGKGV